MGKKKGKRQAPPVPNGRDERGREHKPQQRGVSAPDGVSGDWT